MNKCIGCGITLQNDFKDGLGYTSKLDNLYCERCFRTIHYNEEKKVNNLNNKDIINNINSLKLFTIFITDLENINDKVIKIYKSIKNNKILVINKIDKLPKLLDINHVMDNLKNSYNISEEVIFISAKNNLNIDIIKNIINKNKGVIMCGETSSGKSTLINNIAGSNLTTSKYNNTTLDIIKVPFIDSVIYDTPGIIINDNLKNSKKLIIKNIQIDDDYIIIINDLIIRSNSNLTFIINDNLNIISKKDNMKLDNIINIDSKSDIVLPYGGFIYVKASTKIESNKKLEIRKSLIGR